MTDTLERVKTYKQFIGGEFVDAADGRTADVINPANDQVDRRSSRPARPRTSIARSGAAATAFETWKKTTPQDRSLLLLKLADALEGRGRRARPARERQRRQAGRRRHRRDRRRASTCSASSPAPARVMDGLAANEFVAGHTSIIRRDPIGVVASIAPVELPALHGDLEARARARDRQHGRAQAIGPDAAERAGLRRDPGRGLPARRRQRAVGLGRRHRRRARRPSDRSGWSRSPATRSPASASRRSPPTRVKRLHLELGGKAPIIVFDDADVDLAAETLRFAGYWNAGQDCTAATRVIAGPAVYDRFVSALADQVRTIKWGDPAEGDDIEMGSLIAQAQADKVQGMVDRARGERRGRRRWRAPGSGRRLLHADRHRRPGPEVGDHPGRDLRSGRHGPALRRRGPGGRLGQRHARTGSRHRSSRPTSARRCGSPRRSSSATSGSTSTSRSRRRPRTAASSSPAGARTARSTRSRTTRSSST